MLDFSSQKEMYLSLRREPVKVVAVTSGKGGVGKTNLATNMAVALSTRGRKVMVLDADMSLANVDVLLGLRPRFNLSHVMRGEVDLDSTIMEGPRGIRIVPASSGSKAMTDLPRTHQAAMIQAFSSLEDQPDILIVDTATGISESVARFVGAANVAVVVVRDEPTSLTDAYALIKVFSRHYGISHFEIVTNQTRDPGDGKRLFEKLRFVADENLDVVLRHLGDVPDDKWLQRSVREQRSVADAYPNSPSGRAFARLAQAIDRPAPERRADGSIQFFLERLLCSSAGASQAT